VKRKEIAKTVSRDGVKRGREEKVMEKGVRKRKEEAKREAGV
jgi:hypothetical protein